MKNVLSNKRNLLFCIVFLAALLRIPYLDKFPPALYSDEVNQGYNAYSILKTGKDEHSNFIPISLRSFGDWKPPLQTYLMIPTIAIFGLNEWGVRLPSAVLGVFTVILIYLLTKQFLRLEASLFLKLTPHVIEKIALVAALFLTVSPWHILQSRSAMLVGVALFCLCLFVWSMFKSRTNVFFFYVASFFLCLGIYAYYGMRLTLPLLLIGLVFLIGVDLKKNYKHILGGSFLALILLSPLLISSIQQPDVIFGRARTVSIFYDRGVELTVWELLAHDGGRLPPPVSQFFHNKPYQYAAEILKRFFEHLDGRFIFLIGDGHTPFQIPRMGILYLVDSIFILGGISYLARHKANSLKLIFYVMIISILPAALTYVTPAQNRIFTMVICVCILTAVGVVVVSSRSTLLKIIVAILYSLSFGYFSYQYTVTLPEKHAVWWHYGVKELVSYVAKEESHYENIVFSGKVSMPYIFLLFYNAIDPQIAQKDVRRNYKEDAVGFEYVDSFQKYEFIRYFEWEKDGERLLPNTLLVTLPEEKIGSNSQEVNRILTPNGKPIFNVYKIL